jgi:NitT/TauT family transport system substrate-binding protein
MERQKNNLRKGFVVLAAGIITAGLLLSGCSKKASGATATTAAASSDKSTTGFAKDTPSETIVKTSAAAGKVGNWGLGNEYEILA